MRLDPSNFNRFLNGLGQQVLWREAIDCPCRNPHSGAADQACALCHGVGQAWSEYVEGVVALSGQKQQREWAAFGLWESGDLVVTIPSDSPLYILGEFDRVTFINSSEPFSLTQVREKSGPLPFLVRSLERCVVRGTDDQEHPVLVELAVPTLDEHNQPTWGAGQGPDPLQTYSLAGRKYPEYFVYGNFPQDRAHHQGLDLPRKIILRRFDLFGRTR